MKKVAVLEILKHDHPSLRRPARRVRVISRSVLTLLDDMQETMRAASGVGLAATQVGVPRRVVVIDVGEGLIELINPEIIARSGEEVAVEGCLSVPGLVGDVTRAARVTVEALDRHGRPVWVEGESLLSRALQHELDHLDGILFLDRAHSITPVYDAAGLKVVFLGTPEFAVPSLYALERQHQLAAVITQPDRVAGRKAQLCPPPVKVAAAGLGLDVWQPTSCRDPQLLAALAGLDPDLLVVVAYGQILPQAMLDIPRLGAINAHASLLPKYRGAAPIQRAIMAGETETGVTTVYMNRRLDAGDIILQEAVKILPDATGGSLHAQLANLSARLLVRTLALAAKEAAPRVPQDEGAASYAPRLLPQDEVVDWSRTAESIACQVRALNPRPGAYTLHRGRRLKLWEVRPRSGDNGASCGEVVAVEDEGPVVSTGSGTLQLIRVQPEGGCSMDGGAYLRGHALLPGQTLGRDH
ncbi:MAG TPA: methionyl-tRNA formyltransferase [Clostridiales bacterium UBA8153]|nr:methionyl-tRNA formyltransferase [Clostridiales bacterium UBA8153]